MSTASLLFSLLRVFLVYYKYLDKLQIKKWENVFENFWYLLLFSKLCCEKTPTVKKIQIKGNSIAGLLCSKSERKIMPVSVTIFTTVLSENTKSLRLSLLKYPLKVLS